MAHGPHEAARHPAFVLIRLSLAAGLIALLLAASLGVSRAAPAAPPRILVVMSYHDGYPWQEEIVTGIKTECGGDCDLRFFALDMKNNPKGGAAKAREAFALYQQWQPDGVIATDDYAQSAFVVPYLKDKVTTPVIFSGVNEEPETYGYPAANVTGVLERLHFKETVALLRQLVPSVKNIGFLLRANELSSVAILKELQLLTREIPGIHAEFRATATLEEALQAARELAGRNDAIYLGHFEGIQDRHKRHYAESEADRLLLAAIGKMPTICGTDYRVRLGVLASVAKSGAEQGTLAVKLLRRALQGEPVSRIEIIRNRTGVRYLNVKTMKELGIEAKPALLRDIKLVTTE